MKRLLSLLVVAVMLLQSVSNAQEANANAAKKLKLNKTSITLEAGKSQTLKVKGAKKKVKWKSTKKNIATVSNKGKVTAKNVGNTTIIATVGKKKLKCKVTVVDNSSSESADTSEDNTAVDTTTSEDIPLDDPVDVNKLDKNDVEVLEAIIKEQRSRGAKVPEDLTDRHYGWSNGKLVSIKWYERELKGELSTAGLDNLKELKVDDNNLTKLDVSKNVNLRELSCGVETQLDVSKNVNLVKLECWFWGDSPQLDVSKNVNLVELVCVGNLTQLDVSKNVKLTTLDCNSLKLNQLDVSKNINLKKLYCTNCQLTQLDVSKNVKLEFLSCRLNPLTQLDLSNNINLTALDCCLCQLIQLDLSKNVNLEGLNCFKNQITQLDLSKNVKLTSLGCEKNVEVIGYNGDWEDE